MGATVGGRQIANAERMPPRKRVGHLTRSTLDGPNQRGRAKSGGFARPNPLVAGTPIRQPDRIVEVSAIGGTHRDRLADGQGLAHTGTDHCETDNREKPNHSICMIAYASA